MSWKPAPQISILDQVLPQYAKISEAPICLSDCEGFYDVPNEEVEEFEQRKRGEESAKEYKALDSGGNVVLLQNPWVRERKQNENGSWSVIHTKPKIVMSAKEAKNAAAKMTANDFQNTKYLGYEDKNLIEY